MSKLTASAARRFVTAYGSAEKSSVAMVTACVDILKDGTPATALVAAVRGAYEQANGSFDSDKDRKRFEILVSQRSFAAQLTRIIGDDAATDPVAIKAALSVASGQLPRKAALAIAESFKGTDDAPGFRDAVKAGKAAHKPSAAAPVKSGQEPDNKATETPAPVTRPMTWKDALEFIDSALATTTDAKAHAAMVKALKATLLRHTMTTQPATSPAPARRTPVKAAPSKAAQKAAILSALAAGEDGATITRVAAVVAGK